MDDIYTAILELKKKGEAGVLVTVVDKEGHAPAPVQAKMLVLAGGRTVGTVGGGELEYRAVNTASQQVLEQKNPLLETYRLSPDNKILDTAAPGTRGRGETRETAMICGGSITLFYEYIGAAAKLVIFGAGHIGRALAYHLKDFDYYITVVDDREEVLKEIDHVQQKFTADPSDISGVLTDREAPEGCFILVATHSHELDYRVLKGIVEAGWRPAYIGLVASQKKVETMQARLAEETGGTPSPTVLYSPAGLDIGGNTPHEIALSIISEIQAVKYGKAGHKHMRDRHRDPGT